MKYRPKFGLSVVISYAHILIKIIIAVDVTDSKKLLDSVRIQIKVLSVSDLN